MNLNLLNKIDSPADVKKLTYYELNRVCREIRDMLISTTSENGGHLASSLGAVDFTVALHKIFDSPKDKIIFDVGHQSYAHKILTGRKNRFSTLRTKGGLSGFPKSTESIHDAFIAGHSSTSISAACGIAASRQINHKDGKVIAVIGDGAFTGGMAFEGLNNAKSFNNIIVVLNDNEMSISKNVGAFSKYLSNIRTHPEYFKAKDRIESTLDKTPIIGAPIKRALLKSKSAIKSIIYHSTFFEDLGYTYLGPVDGHDIKSLCEVFARAKALNKPVFVHINTIKGKGYDKAEINPGAYHGLSKISASSANNADKSSFSDEFGKELTQLAESDNLICAVTAAMKYGTGLQYFAHKFKNRFFDVGIAEQHAVTFCAGLASEEMKPVFAVYSTFLQRAYDQVLHDCAIEKKHIVLGVDRSGIVGEDGETHQGLFDVSFLSNIPHTVIYSPALYSELKYTLNKALYEDDGISAVRYPRGAEPDIAEKYRNTSYSDYSLYKNTNGKTLVITYGRISAEVFAACDRLLSEDNAFDMLKLLKIFPISNDIVDIAKKYNNILFVEEGIKSGGLAEHFAAKLLESGYCGHYFIKAIDNQFVKHSTVAEALNDYGLSAQKIAEFVLQENLF